MGTASARQTAVPQPAGLTGAQLIGADEVTGSGPAFRASDPRTGAPTGLLFTAATRDEAELATRLAQQAFHGYRHTSLEARAAFLESIARHIEDLGPTLLERVRDETGLPAARVESERDRTTGQLRMFAAVVREGGWLDAHIDPALPGRTHVPRPDLRRRRIPLGPVVVFTASNFPLAFSVAGGDTASALTAGAPVVVKAHPSHPGTSELVGRAVRAAVREHGLPEGAFSLLHGPGPDLGRALVTDPRIKAVGFTGSRQGGLALCEAASRRPEPIPVFAEMSSVNPVFLLPDALRRDPDGLGRAFITSVTSSTGQMCTSPGLVFAHEGEDLERFVRAAAAAVRHYTATPMLSPGIHGNYTQGLAGLEAVEGVTVRARGGENDEVATPGRAAVLVTDAETFLATPALRAEVFGPASLVVGVPAATGMENLAAALEGQLTATVHATDADLPTASVSSTPWNSWPGASSSTAGPPAWRSVTP